MNSWVFSYAFCFIFGSCSELIEYSIFDNTVKKEHINEVNARRISSLDLSSDTLRFAVFSDSHENYDDISDALASIHCRKDIQFIVSCGDVTSFGFAQEYTWYSDVIKKSALPVITLIGNHDCRANGDRIFKDLFGPTDMSFTLNRYKFVLFNNSIWENENHSPRYEWLRDELADSSFMNLVFCHLPPYTGEFNDLHRMVYNSIVIPSRVIMAIHGQFHYFSDEFYNGIHTLIVNAVDHRDYSIISVVNDKCFVERIYF